MLFNSVEFLLFLPIVFTIYWALSKKLILQNIFLLTASYFFYGLWDYRFLSLIIISSLLDFIIGLQLKKHHSQRIRKILLSISLLVNLGFLLVFKYYNFFVDSFVSLFQQFGYEPSITTLKIVLPVGISFYTFQTLSYSIDIYRNKLEPSKSILNFFTYVAFFPQLVAGPIERAINLLPQIERKRVFDYKNAKLGLRQILWGLFKKVVIADTCALFVDPIFADYTQFSTVGLVAGAVFFAIQIYCDFSGYSDIAIGVSKLLGIELMQNFSFPYFSRDIAEFWRRWHISLSTWFRDYLYIPLGGSRVSKALQLRNIFIIFLVSGFWHGANWTFIFWGLIHALCYIPLLYLKKNRKNLNVVAENNVIAKPIEFFEVIKTFIIVTFAWVFFRAKNIKEGFDYIVGIFSNTFYDESFISKVGVKHQDLYIIIFFTVLMFIIEWFNRSSTFGLGKLPNSKVLRYVFYVFLCLTVLEFFSGKSEFIYFQF